MTDGLKIGYALSLSTPAGIIGGVLVTDEKGFPLEFQKMKVHSNLICIVLPIKAHIGIYIQ